MVIGVGNPDRSDDGCGRETVRRLRERVGERAELAEVRGEPTRLLDLWDHRGLVYVVDAIRSGRPPGTIRRIEVGERTALATIGGTSTHGLSLAESIGLGRALHRLPERLVVFGIEIDRLSPGTAFTPPVAGAIDEVVALLAEEMGFAEGDRA
jgi:hydrogenase maturation protease